MGGGGGFEFVLFTYLGQWLFLSLDNIMEQDLDPLNPLMRETAKNRLRIPANIFQQKHFIGKYLKEKCSPNYNQGLSFKYFVKSFLIYKLSSKVAKIQTTVYNNS